MQNKNATKNKQDFMREHKPWNLLGMTGKKQEIFTNKGQIELFLEKRLEDFNLLVGGCVEGRRKRERRKLGRRGIPEDISRNDSGFIQNFISLASYLRSHS